jgi:hypothetical protein
MHISRLWQLLKDMAKGSSTSGNYAHAGRMGTRGGSEGPANPHPEDKGTPTPPSLEQYERKLRAARSRGLSEKEMLLQNAASYWNGATDGIQAAMLAAVGNHNVDFIKRPFAELPTMLRNKMANKYFTPKG